MIAFDIEASWTTVRGSQESLRAIEEFLTLDDPDAKHSPAFVHGRWDGRVKLYKWTAGNLRFPSGLVPRVGKHLVQLGFPKPVMSWKQLDAMPPLCKPQRGITLRPEQSNAVEQAVRMRRACVQAPMRSGKTEIGIEFVRVLGRPALWTVPSKVIFDQTRARIQERLGYDVVKNQKTLPIALCTIQKLARMLDKGSSSYNPDWFLQFETLVMDESHHAAAATWQAVAFACSAAHYRLGLSGTQDLVRSPLDRLRIEGTLGPIITITTMQEQIERGNVVRPTIILLRPPAESYPTYRDVREIVCPGWKVNPRQLRFMGTQLFAKMYELGILCNRERNTLALRTAVEHVRQGEKFVILCRRVPHAVLLAEELLKRDSGFPVWSLDGGAPEEERFRVLEIVRNRAGGALLIATPFFQEGTDAPWIDSGMLAGGGESDIAVLQSLSRMLTVRPGKREAVIYDFRDGDADRHARKDYLRDHSASRIALYQSQGFEVRG